MVSTNLENRWHWQDRGCILALAEVLREGLSARAMAHSLNQRYGSSLSNSSITSGLSRPSVLALLKHIAPDADVLLEAYRSRSSACRGIVVRKKERVLQARAQKTPKKKEQKDKRKEKAPEPEEKRGPPELVEDLPTLDPSVSTSRRRCAYSESRNHSTFICVEVRTRGNYCTFHADIMYYPSK